MSLESFYGGKQGISPVIKNSFEFIDVNDPAYQAALASGRTATELLPLTMDLCFENVNYKDVWYDELCIIDTVNKNNPNNGKLFKRTLKSTGDTGENLCAEYIGRIVGPAGTNPFFSFGNLDYVSAQGTTDKINLAPEMQVSYPIDTAGNISSAKTQINGDVEEQINIVPAIQSASIGNTMLVPGKQGSNYNDSIKYTWLNVLDDTRETPTHSIVYMGFQIPYPILEIDSETIDWMNNASIEKRDTGGHIFYHPWHLTIPRGVRGNAATNIRLTKWEEFNIGTSDTQNNPTLYNFNDFESTTSGVYYIKSNPVGPPYPWADDESKKPTLRSSYIWVYDYTFYDTEAYDNPSTAGITEISKTYTFYLGSYKEITNVELNDDGTLIFHYSNSTVDTYEEQFQWINDTIISNTGMLSFVYNNEKYRPTADSEPQTGKTYYKYVNNQYEPQTNLQEFESNITYYEFSNVYSKQLPYPTDILVGLDGVITLNLRDGSHLTVQDETGNRDYKLDYVNEINIEPDTKIIKYRTSAYNGSDYENRPYTPLNNSEGINYIKSMTIDEKYHLLAYYASTQYRITQEDITRGWKGNSSKIITTDGNYAYWDGKTFRKGIQGYDNIYWQDFGTMRDVAFGVKVYTTVDYSQHPDASIIDSGVVSPEDFITTVLNPQVWSSTKTNPYYGGEIPGAEEGQSLRGTFLYVPKVAAGSLFFYDYDKDTWVYAGSLGDSNVVDAQIRLNTYDPNDPQTKFNSQDLSTYGVALVERTPAANMVLLPDFGVDDES